MTWIELLRVAGGSIARNKLRSFLTMLGIIIGVASVIIMIAISAGTEAAIEEEIVGLGSNLIYVSSGFRPGGARGQPGPAGGLTYDDTFAIAEQVPGVRAVVVEQGSVETIRFQDVVLDDVNVLGTTADLPSVRDMELAAGRYFTQEEIERKHKVAVLGTKLAKELFAETDPLYQTITVGDIKMTVIGVFAERGMVGGVDFDAQLYAPIEVVFRYFTPTQFARLIGDRVRVIYVELEDPASMEETIQQISLLLAKRHDVSLDEADFTITTQQDIIKTRESTTAAFRNLLAWVAGVSLVVGGIGIMNIMLVSVTERTREIGIRQAVGATPNDIRAQFLIEALMLSLVGGLIGLLGGVVGAWIFANASGMRTEIVPASMLMAFTSAAAVGVFFGFYPASKAAQLDPIEALRHE